MKNKGIFLLFNFIAAFALGQGKSIQERLGYPKEARLVIIHADDLGVSHSENAASIEALEKGSVRSASIMVPCPWFPEIAAYAKANPDKDLGLHLTLTSEWKHYKWGPVTAPDKVPGLINEYGYLHAAVDSVFQHATAAEAETEMRNQVKRAKLFGLDPSHLDAHMGTALYQPDYFKAYLKIAHEFRIPAFIPRQLETVLKIKLDTLVSSQDVLVDYVVTASPTDFKAGFKDFYSSEIKKLKPGLTYLIIHTAFDDAEMKAVTTDHPDWGAAWRQQDFDFFTSSECAKLLKENNIYVITWKEIRDKITRK